MTERASGVEPVVTARGLRVRYPDGRMVAVGGLPFTVREAERVALIGPNGSGKSTLLRAILGLVRPDAGEVRVFGRDPARDFDVIRPRLGAVLQDVDAQLLAPTVREDLAFGLDPRTLSRDEIARRVEGAAMAFGLETLLDKVPHYLSGGEKRKVALAGALVTEPDLLVLDEPFAGLDPRSRAELVAMLREAHTRRGMAVLLTTHEVEELTGLVDAVYVLSQESVLRVRDTPEAVFQMPDLLAAANVPVPPMARLLGALRAHGIQLDPSIFDATELGVVLAERLAAGGTIEADQGMMQTQAQAPAAVAR